MEALIGAVVIVVLALVIPILVEAIWGDLKSGCLAMVVSFLTLSLVEWVLTRMGFIGYFH